MDTANQYFCGVGFGNSIWNDPFDDPIDHDERDYKRVADMGMNAIRFYMTYRTFEDDTSPYVYKTSGFAWLDQEVGWARKHGVYLILNIVIPQGGFHSDCKGDDLWNVQGNQTRLVALWRAIAERYTNEPVIAGYGLLNEPAPTQSIARWEVLSERIVKAIREVDKQHMLVVEFLTVDCNWKTPN